MAGLAARAEFTACSTMSGCEPCEETSEEKMYT